MNSPTRLLLTAAFSLLSALISHPANAQTVPPTYTLTEIAPGKGFHGQHMNALGEIVGSVDTATPGLQHAAIYKEGKLIDLGAKINPTLDSFANFVNLFGVVSVETFVPQTGLFVGYIYFHGIFFPIPRFPNGASLNEITSLNDFGQFVGNFIDPTTTNGGQVSGFLDQPDGVFRKLPIIPMGRRDINDVGQILGDYRTPGNDAATIRQPGGNLVPLGFTSGSAINQLGHVCGWDNLALNVFLYTNGKVTNLGHLAAFPPLNNIANANDNFTLYFAEDVNNFDVVVGEIESNISSTVGTGWVYMNGTMYDLAKSITPQTGSLIVTIVGTILDNGQILATGGFSVQDDLTRTFLLTPTIKKAIRP